MDKAFFFQTQHILDSSSIFDQLKKQQIFFSYFQVDQKYYLFFYSQKSIQIDFLCQSIHVIQELDSKQRKIRSLRGFFLYALEIIQGGKDYEILETNLQPFFWRKVHNIIKQNKKDALLEFLFGKAELNQDQILGLIPHLQDQMKALNNQVDSLQQKIIQLEQNQNIVRERNLNVLSEAPKRHKIDSSTLEYDNYTLEGKKGPNLLSNDSKVNLEVKEPSHKISESFSEDSTIDFKTSERSEQYHPQLKLKPKIQ